MPLARLDRSTGRRHGARRAGAARKTLYSFCYGFVSCVGLSALNRPNMQCCSACKQSGAEQQISCLLDEDGVVAAGVEPAENKEIRLKLFSHLFLSLVLLHEKRLLPEM